MSKRTKGSHGYFDRFLSNSVFYIALGIKSLSLLLLVFVDFSFDFRKSIVAGELVYSTDFEHSPQIDGWVPEVRLVETEGWSLDMASSGNHSLKIRSSDILTTPVIRGDPRDFYRIQFNALGEGVGYGPDRFQIDLSSDWTGYEMFYRSTQAAFRRNFYSRSQQPYYIDDFSIEAASALEFREWADDVYAGFNQQIKLPDQPDPYRWLPNTMFSLIEGQDLRIVMLGDSIVNDTYESYWDTLVEAHYPFSAIETIKSVRGSTGAWWYKEEDRVRQWVLDHDPDLVMIGGISHQEDVESIREVIQQIRTDSDAEILVMTGVAGHQSIGDPRLLQQWEFNIDLSSSNYRSRLSRMAGEEQVGFVDLRASWGQFMLESEESYEYYMRDSLHMNHRGQQIVARSLEKFFTDYNLVPITINGRGDSYRQNFDSLSLQIGETMPTGWNANTVEGLGRYIHSFGLDQGSLEGLRGVVNVGGNFERFSPSEDNFFRWQQDLDGNGALDENDIVSDAAEDRALGIARLSGQNHGQLIFESTIVNDRLKAFTLDWDLEVWGADPREAFRSDEGTGFQVEVAIGGITYLQQSHRLKITNSIEEPGMADLDKFPTATLIDGNHPQYSLRNQRSNVVEVDPFDGANGQSIKITFDSDNSKSDFGWIPAIDNFEFLALSAGDSDGDGDIDPFDILKILSANKFGKGPSNASWGEGDFDQDDDVDPLDIVQILVSIQNHHSESFASRKKLDTNPHLFVNPRTGSLSVDTRGLKLISLIIDSQAGIFQSGNQNLDWQSFGEFSINNESQISRTSFNSSISGFNDLGTDLIAKVDTEFDFNLDLSFFYLDAGGTKLKEGRVVITLPEPSSVVLLLVGSTLLASVLTICTNLKREEFKS